MTKLTKTTVLNTHASIPETLMDKRTRIVREIIDEEAEQRQVKNARLRIARLEREANTPTEAATRKTRSSKTVTKR